MICGISRFLLSFYALTDLVVCLFLFSRNLVCTGSYAIIFPCLVWKCIPLWIFKAMFDIWDINPTFICAAASSNTSSAASSSNSSTFYHISSDVSLTIETSTSSDSAVTTSISIDTTLCEAEWLRVGGWVKSCSHRRKVRGCLDKYGWLWWPTNVDLCLHIFVLWRDLLY